MKTRALEDEDRIKLGELIAVKTSTTSEGCRLWTGTVHTTGHGSIAYRRRTYRPHRVIYELEVAPIPQGMVLDPQCKRKLCVNPDHMNLITAGQRMNLAKARNAKADQPRLKGE